LKSATKNTQLGASIAYAASSVIYLLGSNRKTQWGLSHPIYLIEISERDVQFDFRISQPPRPVEVIICF
jgi:hypothetical protein